MNEYVPFASVKRIVDVVELDVAPLSFTDQLVPEGMPFSVNKTVYVGGGDAVKVTVSVTLAPATVTVPEDGLPS